MKHSSWNKTERGLVCEYEFFDFEEAFEFLTKVAKIAEHHGHHPEIWNSYNKVRLTLFTHDSNAITEKDYSLASEIDAL